MGHNPISGGEFVKWLMSLELDGKPFPQSFIADVCRKIYHGVAPEGSYSPRQVISNEEWEKALEKGRILSMNPRDAIGWYFKEQDPSDLGLRDNVSTPVVDILNPKPEPQEIVIRIVVEQRSVAK